MGRRDNLSYRRNWNNVCRYSTFKGVEHKSPPLTGGLHIVTSFQGGQYGKDGAGVILQWRILTNTISARWPRSTSTIINHVDTYALDMMLGKWHFTSVILPKTHNPYLIMKKKKTEKPQLRDLLQNTWPGLLQTVHVIRNKESLRNCDNQV